MPCHSIDDIIHNYVHAQAHLNLSQQARHGIETAITHDSAITAPTQRQQRERLEFLGDSVISLAVADMLLHRYPNANEGFLTRARIRLVNGCMQAELCRVCGLASLIHISPQGEAMGARQHKKTLEDCFEAFVGALYSHLGPPIADIWVRGVIDKHIGDWNGLIQGTTNASNPNPKACLLARLPQVRFRELNISIDPTTGQKIFTVAARDQDDHVLGIGRGHTRKAAEMAAARHALQLS